MFQHGACYFANVTLVLHQKNGRFSIFVLRARSFLLNRRCVHDPFALTLVASLRITALTNAGSRPLGHEKRATELTCGRPLGYEGKAKTKAATGNDQNGTIPILKFEFRKKRRWPIMASEKSRYAMRFPMQLLRRVERG